MIKPKEIEEKKQQVIHYHDNDMTAVTQPTELGESLTRLTYDRRDNEHGMTSMDLISNLHPIENNFILCHDSLVHLHVLTSQSLGFTRQRKRLSCSESGFRSKQMVEVVVGKREADSNSGLFRRMGEGIKHVISPNK